MSITSDILREFVQGASFDEIYRKYKRSSSAIYTAWRKFISIKDKELEDMKAEREQVQGELTQGQLKSKSLEELRLSLSGQIKELRRELEPLQAEKKDALSVLEQFRKMGLKPTEGLQILGKTKNLMLELSSLSEAASEKSKELATLERQVPAVKEDYLAWQRRRDVERRKVWDLASQAGNLSKQAWQLTQYIERLKGEATTLEDKSSTMRQAKGELASEARALASEIRALRQKRPKLIFIDEGLNSDMIEKRIEIYRLVQISKGMLETIVSMGEKISRVIDVEIAREARVDKKFAERITLQRLVFDKFVEQGEREAERQIREIAGDGMAQLPFIMERVEMGRVELMALGAQRGERIAELKILEDRKAAFKNAIPGVVAVGG